MLYSGSIVYSFNEESGKIVLQEKDKVVLPKVFNAPIRSDLVNFIHTQVRCNKRQAHGVARNAGVQVSALSWGTGRAVARIPRVKGGGTHRSGQAAYGNMCRGGHSFNPLVTYRKWHRKVNLKQKRFAVASALAASACPALVMARGHKIDNVPQFPLIIDQECQVMKSVNKTKSAVSVLKAIGAYDDVIRSKESKHIRPGKGKMRNRRYLMKKGPLVIHASDSESDFVRAFRNVPGLDLMHVNRMNILKLAPGGHLGRFIVWTADAIEQLRKMYCADGEKITDETNFVIPKKQMSGDISSLINSDAIQRILRPKCEKSGKARRKINPLTNNHVMHFLNPYARIMKKKAILQSLPKKSIQQKVV